MYILGVNGFDLLCFDAAVESCIIAPPFCSTIHRIGHKDFSNGRALLRSDKLDRKLREREHEQASGEEGKGRADLVALCEIWKPLLGYFAGKRAL